MLSKDEFKETAWHKAAYEGHVEVLKKLWDWAKELQMKPKELRNDVFLSRDKYNETVWHKVEKRDHVVILDMLRHWARELQLKPDELRNKILSKHESKETASCTCV